MDEATDNPGLFMLRRFISFTNPVQTVFSVEKGNFKQIVAHWKIFFSSKHYTVYTAAGNMHIEMTKLYLTVPILL